MTYKRDKTNNIYVRYPFAEDEIAAWAETLRWWRWKQENFGLSVDQKT